MSDLIRFTIEVDVLFSEEEADSSINSLQDEIYNLLRKKDIEFDEESVRVKEHHCDRGVFY